MEMIFDFRKVPRAYVCSSKMSVTELVGRSRKTSKDASFVILLEYADEIAKRLLPAYLNAFVRFRDGMARAESMQMETMMFACGEMNIGKAIEKHGMKRADKFLLFATDESAFRRLGKSMEIKIVKRIQLKLDFEVAGRVAACDL